MLRVFLCDSLYLLSLILFKLTVFFSNAALFYSLTVHCSILVCVCVCVCVRVQYAGCSVWPQGMHSSWWRGDCSGQFCHSAKRLFFKVTKPSVFNTKLSRWPILRFHLAQYTQVWENWIKRYDKIMHISQTTPKMIRLSSGIAFLSCLHLNISKENLSKSIIHKVVCAN